MAKWYGKIGFATQVETSPGIHIEEIETRNYRGEVTQNTRRLQATDQLNDDINITTEISILADPYVNENFHAIRYVEFMGTRWKVPSVRVGYPRLYLTLGGVYNG